MKYSRLEVFFEFLIFGILMGVAEDAIAITLITGEPITFESVLIIILVAIPFAAFGELIVDRIDLIKKKSKS